MELSQHEKELFGKSKTTGDRPPNLRHGKYLLMVDRWLLHRGYRNVLSDVHNFIVVKSEAILVMEDDKERKDTPNEVGTRVGVTFKYDGAGAEMAPINSTRFTLSMLGIGDNDIDETTKIQAWERMTNDDPKRFVGEKMDGTDIVIPSVNPCRGMLIAAETSPVLTAKNKKWIVGVSFIHVAAPGVGENSYTLAAKRWAEHETKIKAIAA